MHHGGIYAEEISGKVYDTRLLLRFAKYIRPYRTTLIYILLILPVIAACRLAHPIIIKLAIDRHIIPAKLNGLEQLALAFVGILALESLLSFFETYFLQSVGQKIMADMRGELFDHVSRLPVSWFDKVPTGSAVTRLTSDIEVLGEMFASGIITIVGDVMLLIGIVAVMLWMNPKLSLVTFSVLPVLAYVTYTFRRRMRQSFREVRARLGSLNSFLAESIGGISIIQIFNRERDEERRFSELNESYRDANMPVIFWDASLYALVEALSSIAVALIIWYGGGQIVQGTLTFGLLVAFIQYIEKFFGPIRDLSAKYSVMQGAMAALERIFALLDTTAEQSQYSEQHKTVTALKRPLLEFRNVTFSYRPNEKALDDFSLIINEGERIALVGESGGGKTTVTRLLTRLYEVDRGAIFLNGVDIRTISLSTLRQHIGVVLQDPCLFAGTIKFNISLGDDLAESRLVKAATLVGADRFINKLPKVYEEEVLERGNNLSAGEKQLISFARAVAFQPEIMVLDEATASVDSVSEQMIQKGMLALMKGRTSLVVAHRLSTIQDADRIVVIHSGKIVEQGTHQELLALQGTYFRLQRAAV